MNNPAPHLDIRDHREKDWFWANNGIIEWYGEIIGADSIAVYMVLCRHANQNGECWPSYQTIATKLKLSRPTVIKCMKKLEAIQVIAKSDRKQPTKDGGIMADSNMYILLTVKPLDAPSKDALLGMVNEIDHPPSKGALPDLVKEVNHPSKGALPKQDSLNKTHRTSVSEQPEKPKQLDALSRALFELCLIDPDLAPPTLIGQMRKTYKALKSKAAEADQVSVTFASWWYSDSNWTTRKAREKGYKPEPPKPEQVLTEWTKAMAAAPKKQLEETRGHQPERKQRSGAEIREALARIEATGK